MNKWRAGTVLGTACCFLMAGTSYAQQVSLGTLPLWDAALETKNAPVKPWGNGEAQRERGNEYLKFETLSVTTRGPREGVFMDLNPGVDIAPYQANGFLRVRLNFTPPRRGRNNNQGDRRDWRNRGQGDRSGRADYDASPMLAEIEVGAIRTEARAQLSPADRELVDRQTIDQTIDREWLRDNEPPGGWQQWLEERRNAAAGDGPVPGLDIPGMGIPGMDDWPVAPVGPPPQTAQLKQLMVTLVREEGIMSGAIDVDLDKVQPDDEGWRLFDMPLRNLRATPNASGAVQRIVLTSDEGDTFSLAQMALVVETGAMTVAIRRPNDPVAQQVAEILVRPNFAKNNAPLSLVADVEAGTADPIIEWNFDADNTGFLPPPPNAVQPPAGMIDPNTIDPAMFPPGVDPADFLAGMGGAAQPQFVGPRIDAVGPKVTFEYPNEEQNYRVEVTVRDRLGKKEPVKASVRVLVRG